MTFRNTRHKIPFSCTTCTSFSIKSTLAAVSHALFSCIFSVFPLSLFFSQMYMHTQVSFQSAQLISIATRMTESVRDLFFAESHVKDMDA